MMSPWASSSHYVPYCYLSPRLPREINAETPLLEAQHDVTVERESLKALPQNTADTMAVLLRQLSFDIAPRAIDALCPPLTKNIEHRLQMQISFAMQQYHSAECHDAKALLRAALQTALRYDIAAASLLDTGGASPLYVALLYHDVSLAREIIQAGTCTHHDDLPLLRACIATQDLELFDALLPYKLLPAATGAHQGEPDAIVAVVEAIFDTQNKAYIASALCVLLTQDKAFAPDIIKTWQALLDNLVTQDEPLFSPAWVFQMSRSPRSRAPQPRRVCRQSLVRGFCQSLVKRDDAIDLIAHLTPTMRRYALQRAMDTGQLDLCRALVIARASESASAMA